MRFRQVAISMEHRFAVGVDEDTGKHCLEILIHPRSFVDALAYYDIDLPTFERFSRDPRSAAVLVERCREGEMEHARLA